MNIATLLLPMTGIEPGPPGQQASVLFITPLPLGTVVALVNMVVPNLQSVRLTLFTAASCDLFKGANFLLKSIEEYFWRHPKISNTGVCAQMGPVLFEN